VPRGSSSTSIGKLWPDIDELDEISRDGTSGRGHQGGVLLSGALSPPLWGWVVVRCLWLGGL
jgi:hypothetical protein